MSAASEKYREAVRSVLAEVHKTGLCMGALEVLMLTLASAERDGREAERTRCADLLAAITSSFRRREIENDWTALIETLSTAILSEAGGER